MSHKNGSNDNPDLVRERVGYTKTNTQNVEMTCIEYKNCKDITVEFKTPHYITKSNWGNFIKGKIRNPYVPTVYGVGIVGNKYPTHMNGNKHTKEYQAWHDILYRIYGCNHSDSRTASYKDCSICDEWLFFENFYEWLHSQKNFDKWLNGKRWCVDKDLICRGNRVYCPDKCCLVPNLVNTLLVKRDIVRGGLPVGIQKNHDRFCAMCSNPITNDYQYCGTYDTIEEAFDAYKKVKEHIIKRVAQIEFDNGNIIEECYNAMMKYEVNIDD